MIASEPAPPVAAALEQRTPRFGVRVPPAGAPVPFRVLISTRWLYAGALAFSAALLGVMKVPLRLRLPSLLGGSSVLGLIALVLASFEARRPKFERITLPIADLPRALDGFTIIQLTDLHLGSRATIQNFRRALTWVRTRQPDLIVFTGDFISFHDQIALLQAELPPLCAPYGVYAIFGNHDYWTKIEQIAEILQARGITLLRNEQRRIQVGDATLMLVGLDCIWEERHDLEVALANIPPHTPTIVLAHEPDIADEVAPYAPMLQLSGHTHAGHIAMPGLGPLFLPRHGFRYFRGLQRVGQMWLYVSRGLGGYPLRLGCPPEVTEITLVREQQT